MPKLPPKQELPYPNLRRFALQTILKTILPLIILLWGTATCFYTVQPDEVAVVLRFGRYHKTFDSGLQFKLPFGIDEAIKVQITQIRTEEFGFRTQSAGVQTIYRRGNYSSESLMLTGDLNCADVSWIVQYRISAPVDYLFQVEDKRKTLRDISESIMRQIIGDRSIDEVLTIGRLETEVQCKAKMQELLNQYKMGISITLVKLQNVKPPERVASSFNDVNKARQEREQSINEARKEYNQKIPVEEGEAERKISQAKGYLAEKVNNAKGEVAKFNAVLKEYRKAPDITRMRLYLETMSEIYAKTGRKIIVDEEMESLLPLLNLEK